MLEPLTKLLILSLLILIRGFLWNKQVVLVVSVKPCLNSSKCWVQLCEQRCVFLMLWYNYLSYWFCSSKIWFFFNILEYIICAYCFFNVGIVDFFVLTDLHCHLDYHVKSLNCFHILSVLIILSSKRQQTVIYIL